MAYITGSLLPIYGSARIVEGADVGTGYDRNMPGYMENVPWHVALVSECKSRKKLVLAQIQRYKNQGNVFKYEYRYRYIPFQIGV